MCRFPAERIITYRFGKEKYGISFTKRERRLQNGNLAYKTGLSFTNWDTWITNGTLGLQFTIHVFDDENRIEIYDIEHSTDEDRYNTIGLVHDILFVVYTERRDRLRIISARLATEKERKIYYDSYSRI